MCDDLHCSGACQRQDSPANRARVEAAARAAQADLIRVKAALAADLQKRRIKLCRKNGGHIFESSVCLACGGVQSTYSGY